MSYFVDVILPIPIRNIYTYAINKDEAAFLKPGMRVTVSFGKSKVYTSVVQSVHTQESSLYEAKEIEQILDEFPIVTHNQLQFWQWIADYYMCTLGEVMKAALSRQFLLESETLISLNAEKNVEEETLSNDEWLVVEALQVQHSLRIEEIQKILNKQAVLPLLHRLVTKNIVQSQEEAIEQYKPKWVKYIRLHNLYASDENLKLLLENLSNAPKQKEAIVTLFALQIKHKKEVKLKELQEQSGVSAATVKALVDKNILEEYTVQQDRISFERKNKNTLKNLSSHQQKAYCDIKESFQLKSVALLHGVTSGGKTEVYSKLIEDTLNEGKQVLFMVPEIALTTQLIKRLQDYFADKMVVYHSKYSPSERVEVWHNVLQNKEKSQIVIGARSSIFLPFQNLGLIIVDEEHEPSYKQFSPSPRYHARDAAIVLSSLHNAKVLLGSATPSLETYYNVKEKKYGLATLTERFGNVQMPLMEFVDLRTSYFKKKMKGHFSHRLIEAIENAFNDDEQVILFQNRRGFSPTIECQTCGHSPLCPNCDVTLTYHQYNQQLRCHYCGHHIAMQQSCMACGSSHLDTKGLGTEQIEEEFKVLFPNKKIARMDYDTTKGKHAYAKLIESFEQGEIDILVGTQMIAKGLDFRKVSLVGVLNADNLLNFPDFRAHERSFQLLLQVAGRAGRTDKQGTVIIQTYNPAHAILQQVVSYNYEAMYREQAEHRQKFYYPPYYRLIKITVKDRKFVKMNTASQWFAQALKNIFSDHVMGPTQPPVGRIRNEYITNILVKIPKNQSISATKNAIRKIEKSFLAVKEFRSVKLLIDVDCY